MTSAALPDAALAADAGTTIEDFAATGDFKDGAAAGVALPAVDSFAAALSFLDGAGFAADFVCALEILRAVAADGAAFEDEAFEDTGAFTDFTG